MTSHIVTDIFSSQGYVCPIWPMIVVFYFTIFFCWFGEFILPMFEYCCPKLKISAIEVDQPIDNYFASCDDEDRAWTVEEEKNSRENIQDLKILLDSQFEKMKNTPTTKAPTL